MECRGTSLYLEAQHSVVTYTKGSGVCLILMVSTQAHLLQVLIHRIEKLED